MTKLRATWPTLAAVLLIGCHEQSSGDEAIAFVDGRPLMGSELAADLTARRLSTETVSPAVRSAATSKLIDRVLLVKQAKQEALDQDPNYKVMAAQAQESILIQQLLNKWRSSVVNPSKSDVRLFIDSNPQMFADRVIYLLDEVQTDAKGLDARALAPFHSMDAVIEYLHQNDRPFRRGSASFDTLTMGPVPARRIAQLAPGDPFVSFHGTTLIIRAVLRSSPTPLVDEAGIQVATQLWQRAVLKQLVAQKLKTLRAAATITYPVTRVKIASNSATAQGSR